MKEQCQFCNGSKVELVDGLGVPCVWCDPVGAAITDDKLERDGPGAELIGVAKPVPPAGDVEVFSMKYGEKPTEEDGQLIRHADHLAVVTRLTAERDVLQQRLEVSDRFYNIDVDHLQSELTKARELNEHLSIARNELESTLRVVAVAGSKTSLSSLRTLAKRSLNIAHGLLSEQSVPTPIAHNADESCGQDAEAAKCARCEASTVEICDEKGCGFLGAGNGAPAASTVNGLTDDEWQDRDDQDRQELERE